MKPEEKYFRSGIAVDPCDVVLVCKMFIFRHGVITGQKLTFASEFVSSEYQTRYVFRGEELEDLCEINLKSEFLEIAIKGKRP
jgi:hypothetical protein